MCSHVASDTADYKGFIGSGKLSHKVLLSHPQCLLQTALLNDTGCYHRLIFHATSDTAHDGGCCGRCKGQPSLGLCCSFPLCPSQNCPAPCTIRGEPVACVSCYAVLCRAMRCCAVLCCAVPCCAVLCCAVLCCCRYDSL